jgi:hypothetical protein
MRVVEEKTIVFYEDELIAVKMEDGTIYVPVTRLCDNLGIDWSAQRQRINRDEVLSESLKGVVITTTPSLADGRGGGPQEHLCLPLDLIPGWLFGIQASRVKEDVRDKLIRYRRECFRVLWDAFKSDLLPELQEPTTELTMAEKTLAQAEAFYNLAHQQVVMERWLRQHDWRLEEAEDRLENVEEIVEDLRLRVQGPGRLITDTQAAEIAAEVKSIAFELTERNPSRNWYQSIYGELYRRLGITSYRRVPADRFGEVIAWLEGHGQRFE